MKFIVRANRGEFVLKFIKYMTGEMLLNLVTPITMLSKP